MLVFVEIYHKYMLALVNLNAVEPVVHLKMYVFQWFSRGLCEGKFCVRCSQNGLNIMGLSSVICVLCVLREAGWGVFIESVFMVGSSNLVMKYVGKN